MSMPVRRLIAWALDYVVIAGYLVILAAASIGIQASGLHGLWIAALSNAGSAELAGFVTLTLPVVLYFAFFEASPTGATFGKRALGLRVTALDGSRLSLGRALLRSAVKFLPWELAHFTIWHYVYAGRANPPAWAAFALAIVYLLVAAYLVTLFVGKSHRTVYDRIAGARVVQTG
jgi:uncharacterized RDD family membrane protein YckC